MSALLHADWQAPPRVHAFTTQRVGGGASPMPFHRFNLGLRSGDDVRVVSANRNELIDRYDLPTPPHWLQQVHGVEVRRFSVGEIPPLDGAQEPVADAAVTRDVGVVLAILTADCLPVLFAAKDGSEVAAAHAGWRGLAAGVLERTVAAMHTAPDQVVAWLGPAAGPEAYEVGEEVFNAFVVHDSAAAVAFVATRPGHWKVDLYALARMRLLAAGITADAIYGGGLCTISDPKHFYSHRRDQRTGRMASVIWIEGRQ